MERYIELLNQGKAWIAISELRDKLHDAINDSYKWNQLNESINKSEEIRRLLYKCPYIKRANSKPRGYAGDAVMMDYIYGIYSSDFMSSLDEIGEEVFRLTTNSKAACAVRHRRRFIARIIDSVCKEKKGNIMAVACGHLREALVSKAFKDIKIQNFYALDQDAESLKVVKDEYSRFNVQTVHANAARICKGRIPTQIENVGFDLIYSAGLYDYLDSPTAKTLTKNLATLLNPNGLILLANFMPMHEDVGFMEGIMDWKLIYRTPDQMQDILLDAGLILESIEIDPTNSIVYAIGKKG